MFLVEYPVQDALEATHTGIKMIRGEVVVGKILTSSTVNVLNKRQMILLNKFLQDNIC